MFNISEKAALEINRLLVEEGDTDSFLRIKVVPGGCSGFEYEMGFDDSLDDSDQIFENLNVKVVIDKFSFDHLNGGTLNFSDGIYKNHNINNIPEAPFTYDIDDDCDRKIISKYRRWCIDGFEGIKIKLNM